MASEVGRQALDASLAQDSAIQAARRVYERAQENLEQEQRKEIEISGQIDVKRQQMYGIYSAAMDEGVAFNSPSVLNSVMANQQATAALRSDLAKQQENIKSARIALERAQKEYEEAREKARSQYQSQAEDASKKAFTRLEEAQAFLQRESARQGLVSSEEVNPRSNARRANSDATIPSDGDIANPNLERVDTEEEEQYLDYNTMDDSNRDNAPNPESAASNGTDNSGYSTDFDLEATNFVDMFNRILNAAETDTWEYLVNVPKNVYSSMIGVFERMRNGQRFIDAFFRHTANTEQNADDRFRSGSVDKTLDLARRLSSTSFDVLRDEFGITPVAETENEVILRMPSENNSIFSDGLLQAEQALRDARTEASDIQAIVGELGASGRLARGEDKQNILIQRREYIQKLEAARARVFAAEDALREAKRNQTGFTAEEYVSVQSRRSLDVELANLTDKLNRDADIIANMRSVERAYYRLGNGNVEAALSGEYGGQIPVPLMNIFIGMVADASEGKTGRNVLSRNINAPNRIVDDFAGKYAPFINAVFVTPASHGSDVSKSRISSVLRELGAHIPNRKVNVVVNQDGTSSTQKMSISEIVGHIIDERRTYSSELSDEDYVNERLDGYGITDAETRKAIQDAVDYGRELNDRLYTLVNEALVKNGHYEQTFGYRKWYMHHYAPDVGLAAALGISTNDEEISQVFIDDTGNRRPSHEFIASALQRYGEETGYDFVESVHRSISPLVNAIYQMENVDRLKQLEEAINGTPKLDENGNYVKENNKVVLSSRPMYSVDSEGNRLDKNHLTAFANSIGMIAQRAANKRTSAVDRAVMGVFGRRAIGYLKLAISIRSASAVAFNVKSAFTNFAPVKFLPGICTAQEIGSAMAGTIAQLSGAAESEDYIAAHSAFVKGRTDIAPEERAIKGKVLDAGYALSGAIDRVTVNFMARALFNHEYNTNGGNAEVALVQTEDMLRRMLTDKSRIGRSQFYESTLLGGVIGQFQQESVNELLYMLKDMRYYGGGQVPKALLMMIGVFIMNAMHNFIWGSDSMSDPIGEMVKTFNFMDDDATTYEKAKAVTGTLLSSLNPIDFLETGETPISSAIVDVADGLGGVLSGEDELWEFFGVLGSVLLPGGAAIKRAINGIKVVNQGYAETQTGRVKYVTGEANPLKYAAVAIGGVNMLPQTKGYVYGFTRALGSKQSQKFKALLATGLDPSQAWATVKGVSNANAQTTSAEAVLASSEATTSEIQESPASAQAAREEAAIPSDIAAWAITSSQGIDENSPVAVGIALWQEFGLITYPKMLESEAASKEYQTAYNMIVKSYLRGTYGEVGSRAAAEKLESALRSARNKANDKYAADVKSIEGGDVDGEE